MRGEPHAHGIPGPGSLTTEPRDDHSPGLPMTNVHSPNFNAATHRLKQPTRAVHAESKQMDVKHAVPTTKTSPQPFKCKQSLIPNYSHSSFVFRKIVKSLNT